MTRPLFQHMEEVQQRLDRSNSIWLGTDFDGTLTHHQDDAAAVILPNEMKARLSRLAGSPKLTVAVISGRSLCDITTRVGLAELAYAGNHGMEINAPGFTWVDSTAIELNDETATFADVIQNLIGSVPGVSLDNKLLTLSIDYRPCPQDVRNHVVSVLDSSVIHYPNLRMRHSRYGSEVLPRTRSNKGTAAKLLCELCPDPVETIIYLGDDLTDEDAFTALPDAVTVRVGAGPTAARYRVESADDVGEFFDWLNQKTTRAGR